MSNFLFHIVKQAQRRPCFVARGDEVVSIAQDGQLVRDAFCVTNGAANQFFQNVHYPDGYGRGTGQSKIDPFYQTCTTETDKGAWTECGLPIPIPSLGGRYVEVIDPASGLTLAYDADAAWTMVFNLIPNRRYQWRVIDAKKKVVRRGQFDTTGTIRQIRLHGVRNVRDIGGFPCDGGMIAFNKVWRGNNTDGATPEDIAEFKRWGFTAQLDLRTKSAQYEGSDLGLKYYGTQYNAKKVITADKYGIDAYSGLIAKPTNLLNCIAAIITELEAGGAVYFHCKNGADRTGSLNAVIMGLLGCSENDIIKAWEWTSFCGYLNTKRIHIEDGSGEMRSMCKSLYAYGGKAGANLSQQIIKWWQTKVCVSLADKGQSYIDRLRKQLIVISK